MYLTNQPYFTNCLAWTSHAGIIWSLFTSFETDFKHCKYIFNDWVGGWINIVTCVDDCTTLSVKLSNNYFTFLRRFVLYPDQMFRNQSTFKNSNYDLLRIMHTNKIANTSIVHVIRLLCNPQNVATFVSLHGRTRALSIRVWFPDWSFIYTSREIYTFMHFNYPYNFIW